MDFPSTLVHWTRCRHRIPAGPSVQGITSGLYTIEYVYGRTHRAYMFRPFGPTRVPVAAIGQGTWQLERGDRTAAVAALRRGIDPGMTHIDTAEMYGERRAGSRTAIAGRRDEVFLVSKVLPRTPRGAARVAACERSLKRLKHRPARLLSAALARVAIRWRRPSRRSRSWSRGQDPLLGRQQFRRRRPRRALAVAGDGQDRLQPGAVSSAGTGDRARGDPVVRGARRRGGRLLAVRPGRFSGPDSKPAARCCRRSRPRTSDSPRQVALAFLTRAASAVSRFRKPRSAAHAARQCRPPATGLSAARSPAWPRRFRRAGARASCRRSRAPRAATAG